MLLTILRVVGEDGTSGRDAREPFIAAVMASVSGSSLTASGPISEARLSRSETEVLKMGGIFRECVRRYPRFSRRRWGIFFGVGE